MRMWVLCLSKRARPDPGIRTLRRAGVCHEAAGADDIFILMSSGKHNHEMHEPTDRRFSKETL